MNSFLFQVVTLVAIISYECFFTWLFYNRSGEICLILALFNTVTCLGVLLLALIFEKEHPFTEVCFLFAHGIVCICTGIMLFCYIGRGTEAWYIIQSALILAAGIIMIIDLIRAISS